MECETSLNQKGNIVSQCHSMHKERFVFNFPPKKVAYRLAVQIKYDFRKVTVKLMRTLLYVQQLASDPPKTAAAS